MYSYIKDNNQNNKTAKGLNELWLRMNLNMTTTKVSSLIANKGTTEWALFDRIVLSQLSSYERNKVSLSCFDDKRYIHNDGVTSYAYGQYKIAKSWCHARDFPSLKYSSINENISHCQQELSCLERHLVFTEGI